MNYFATARRQFTAVRVIHVVAILAAATLTLMLATTPVLAASSTGSNASTDESPSVAGEQTGTPLPFELENAAAWLLNTLPQPAPGDELAVLALLRTGTVTPADEPMQQFATALVTHAAGNLDSQPAEQTGWQCLALAALGKAPDKEAPGLVTALEKQALQLPAQLPAMRMALLVFEGAGVVSINGLDTLELAHSLCRNQNPDGGFGAGGISQPLETAQCIQALSFFPQDNTVAEVQTKALSWLQTNQSEFGGFDLNAAPSAQATAEALLAYSLTGQANLLPPVEAALLIFQNADGSFQPNPDSPADKQLTALCSLALLGSVKSASGESAAYLFSGAAGAAGGANTGAASSNDAGTPSRGPSPQIMLPPGAYWPWVVIGIGVFAAGSVVVALLVASRKKKRSGKQHAAAQAEGIKPTSSPHKAKNNRKNGKKSKSPYLNKKDL